MDFKPYYNNWIDVSSLFVSHKSYIRKNDYLPVNLSIEFFNQLNFDSVSLTKYRINAAHKAKKILGSRPALCISGGVDSQAMLQSWIEADINFDAFVLVFKDNLNIMDVEHARAICKNFNVELKEIEIDIIQFLNYFNYEYSIKYNSCSPHFNTHYKLFNLLKGYNYTGVCCGGDAPVKNLYNNSWGGNFTRNPNTFIKYAEVEQFTCIGNFISYYPNLAWAIALQTKPIYYPTPNGHINNNTNNVYINENQRVLSALDNIYKDNVEQRYLDKCAGYKSIGYTILPQTQKFTGFELVKQKLEQETGNGWEFEKRYRQPLEQELSYSFADTLFVFQDHVEDFLNSYIRVC